MKNVKKIIFASLVAVLATGCSNEKSKIEGAFMDACRANGTSKAICSCGMDKLEAKYPGDQFVAINKMPTPDFIEDAMKAGLACRADS